MAKSYYDSAKQEARVTMRDGNCLKKQGIFPEDRQAISDLLNQGHSTRDVYDLVSGEYSFAQVCGIKAALTRKTRT